MKVCCVFLFLTSFKRENILSGSAFEFGSDRTIFRRFVKFGYLVTLFGHKIFFTYHQNLIKKNFVSLFL